MKRVENHGSFNNKIFGVLLIQEELNTLKGTLQIRHIKHLN